MIITFPEICEVEEKPDGTINLAIPLEEILGKSEEPNYLTHNFKTIKLSENKIFYSSEIFIKTELPDNSLKFELNTGKIEDFFEKEGATYILTTTLKDKEYKKKKIFKNLKSAAFFLKSYTKENYPMHLTYTLSREVFNRRWVIQEKTL